MAEIEFKRRGTPLWVVVLALLVVALVLWFVFRQRAGAPATAAAPAAPTTVTPPAVVPPPPAATAGPFATYSAFVDSQPAVSGEAVVPYVAEGLRRLADAMQVQFPLNGVQVNLVRAMSDSLRLPGLTSRRQTDMTQAAFFAAGYAISRGDPQGKVTQAASQVFLDRTLPQQLPAIRSAFRTARDVMAHPDTLPAGAPTLPGGAPATPPPAGGQKKG